MQVEAPENSSRKRPRSTSGDSDSSESSPKRAVSEGPSLTSEVGIRSPGSVEPQPMSNLRIVEDPSDIDAYMAEQQTTPTTWKDVAPADKLVLFNQLKDAPLVLGDSWYMLSSRWLKDFKMACNGETDKEGQRTESALGPVDNSPLVNEGDGELRPGLQFESDYEVVPQRLWDAFVEWYGPPTVILERKVTPRGSSEELYVECNLPVLKVYRLAKGIGTALRGEGKPQKVQISLSRPAKEFFSAVEQQTSSSEYRLWRISGSETEQEQGSEYPIERLRANQGELFIVADGDKEKTLNELLVSPNDEFVIEFKENGMWSTDQPLARANGSGGQELATLAKVSEQLSRPLFNSGNYLNELSTRLGNRPSTSKAESSSSLLQPAPIKARSKSPQPSRVPGTLGLGNLGNTCFMNSALQCLAHNEELTDYFLTELYREELNRDNPLGMGGAIAESFGSLLSKIWSSSGPSSFAPREFKSQLQRFAPQFSGYQQHDSQELVAFLLDGLHEDLNRVLKKPYVENPDWEGGGEKELAELARKSWEGYMSRNDSVIVDLFQGQYKSTLVCPECQKVSITFDPFMYLTLPLPVKKKWTHEIYYVPWDTTMPHLKIPVEMDNDSSTRELRKTLARWTNTHPDHLVLLDTFSHRFYKYFDDHTSVSDINANDHILCYELPTKPFIHIKEKKPSEDGTLILPVYHMKEKASSSYSYSSTIPELFGLPVFVALTPEQTKSRQAIYAAIVDRLQRWTKNAQLLYKYAGVDHPKENGSAIVVNGDMADIPDSEEADIADEKPPEVPEDDMDVDIAEPETPVAVGPQEGIFAMKIYHLESTKAALEGVTTYMNSKYDVSWDAREKAGGPLVMPGDAIVTSWDKSMEEFYLGPQEAQWEKQDFTEWVHPELQEKRNQGPKKETLNIEDCLDEFTKEEQLGEDDLWYCPRCKKHQQATKNLQLWKVPDVLVVHLKRFSSSRIIRDKIDAFIHFPLEGLDLENRVGERQTAKALLEQNIDPSELGLGDLDEPLLYDLFAVDEHRGGLGGGHYRAYAKNHVDGEWYHFDDSHVTKCRPEESINHNAYLLFYRRRTARPIGGKTYVKIQEARQTSSQKASTALPTPPDEPAPLPVEETNGIIGPLLPGSYGDDDVTSIPPLEDEDDPSNPPGLPDYNFTDFIPGGFKGYNGYQGRSGSPASATSSNKADGGSDGVGSPRVWTGDNFSDLGSTSSSPYPSKGTLKPAMFETSTLDNDSWEGIEGPPSPTSRTMSESDDSMKTTDLQLSDQSAQYLPPQPTKMRTVQLPSPEPEE